MGWADRPYYGERPTGGFGSRLSGHSVVVWLIGLNTVIFLLDEILTGSKRAGVASPFNWLNFNIEQGVWGVQLWRWVTYQFLHGDFWHIFFNMMMLFFFGPWIEQSLGPRRFLAFYLLCGCCGAVLYTGLSYVPGLLPFGTAMPLIGASGAILGLIVGCAVLYPQKEVSFWGVFNMRMRTLAIVMLVIAVASILAGSANAGGEAAHLGGALLGFFLVKYPKLLGFADRGGAFAKRLSPGVIQQKMKQRAMDQRAKHDRTFEDEVNRILDKVSREGVQSLSAKEKRTLQQATEKQRE